MKRSRLKISGIYDPRTIEFLQSEQVESFSFDFLPLSSNFLPGHSFEEILKKYYRKNHNFFLYFSQEPDFVIKKTLDDVVTTTGLKLSEINNLYLQFSTTVDAAYADQFVTPYFLNLESTFELRKLDQCLFLRGISFSYTDLELLGDHNKVFKRLNEIFAWAKVKNIQVELRVDWGTSFSASILDFFEFDFFNFSIGPKVEVCYRNVNLGVMGKEVKLIKELVL